MAHVQDVEGQGDWIGVNLSSQALKAHSSSWAIFRPSLPDMNLEATRNTLIHELFQSS